MGATASRRVAPSQTLPISLIRTDGGTQPRAAIDFDAVADYQDAMQAGEKFPPLIVFYDGSSYWLADGFHRREAAVGVDLKEIACDVHQGTLEDAQWFSFSANKTNGIRRTNSDKQRAVKAALKHAMATNFSNRQIAAHVGVDEGTVRAWREKVTAEIPQSAKRTGRDGRTINTANIGKKAHPLVRRVIAAARAKEAAKSEAVAGAPEQSAPAAQPDKRQQQIQNVAYRTMVKMLTEGGGLCTGLSGLNISNVIAECPNPELRTWENRARAAAIALRSFADQLKAARHAAAAVELQHR